MPIRSMALPQSDARNAAHVQNTENRRVKRIEKERKRGHRTFVLICRNHAETIHFHATHRTRISRWVLLSRPQQRQRTRYGISQEWRFPGVSQTSWRRRERIPIRLLAYCIMSNHFHLALWPFHDGDLSRFMMWLMTAHVRRYHKHYHSSGHVWQGRFRAHPIQEDGHLLTVLRYIERNALCAGPCAWRGRTGPGPAFLWFGGNGR